MLKVYINREPVVGPWGGGNAFVKAFHQYASKNGVELVKLNKCRVFENTPDILLMMSPTIENPTTDISINEMVNVRLFNKQHSIIVGRVNECDARKNTQGVDKLWSDLSSVLDATIWVSNWLKSYFWYGVGWKCKDDFILRNVTIVNGVDKTVFKKQIKNNDKIQIVTHHWSDNDAKGRDYVEWLDDFVQKTIDGFSYTFIGRTHAQLKNSRHVPPLFGTALGTELAKHDVYINASRFDPGPNSTIEAITCGLPTYVHAQGGGSVEFAGTDHIFSSFDELQNILMNLKFEQNQTSFLSWELVMKQVFDYLKEVYYVTKQQKC